MGTRSSALGSEIAVVEFGASGLNSGPAAKFVVQDG